MKFLIELVVEVPEESLEHFEEDTFDFLVCTGAMDRASIQKIRKMGDKK